MAETEKEVFRILVPVDGSASSDAAVRFAAQTARSMRAQIDVLYVSYFDHATDAEVPSWLPESVAGAVGHREEATLAHARGIADGIAHCAVHCRTGIPAKEILAFAEERGTDLIVMGSRRMDAVHAALIGSVSTAVLHGAQCPVAVVKAANPS